MISDKLPAHLTDGVLTEKEIEQRWDSLKYLSTRVRHAAQKRDLAAIKAQIRDMLRLSDDIAYNESIKGESEKINDRMDTCGQADGSLVAVGGA